MVETVKANIFRVKAEDPLSAESVVTVVYRMKRPGWDVEVRSGVTLTGDATHFRLVTDLDVFEDGARVHARTWDQKIERDLV